MALLKVRVVVVVLIRRLTDLKMREAALLTSNICLNVLKMRVAVHVAVGAAQDERGSSSKGEIRSPR